MQPPKASSNSISLSLHLAPFFGGCSDASAPYSLDATYADTAYERGREEATREPKNQTESP